MRWIPHVHFGGVSGECIADEIEGGREGHYFEICWFGFMVSLQFSSLFAERRHTERIRQKYGEGDQ